MAGEPIPDTHRAAMDAPILPDDASGSTVVINGAAYGVYWDGTLRRLTYPSENLYTEGHWENGRREGEHVSWYETGELATVESYIHNQRQGLAEAFAPNGRLISSGQYVDGFRRGVWRQWYLSGAPQSEGTYGANQQREGMWLFWDEQGQLTSKSGIYEDGHWLSGF